jgi:hypothetical protein
MWNDAPCIAFEEKKEKNSFENIKTIKFLCVGKITDPYLKAQEDYLNRLRIILQSNIVR